MATVIQSYRYALDPTAGQQAALRSHCGAQRYAFNWGLARVKANLDQRAAEKTYDIHDGHLTPLLSWSAYSLRKDWNHAKHTVAPWWAENSKEAYSSGLANLAAALTNWHVSRTGKRRGPRVRFPRFKGRRARLSCRFTTGAFGLIELDRRHVKLPRIGTMRTHESTRKLARHVERGTARIRSATVSYRSGRWFCSFSVEVTRAEPTQHRPGTVVGVDLGVKSLAVLSTGEIVPNPKRLEVAQRELRRLQRQAARRTGPDKRTGQAPSNRWRRAKARISKLHARVANARLDGLQKLTSRLASTHGVIVIEDLNVSGMLSNQRLSRHISGVGMGELRRQVSYNAAWAGVRVVVADRWYPSSKTCSKCGAAKAKLPLHVRAFNCGECGLVLDRDLNAARNLAALAGENERHVHGELRRDAKQARWKPMSDPHRVGNGYRHGKACTSRRRSTPSPQGDSCLNPDSPVPQVTDTHHDVRSS